VHWQQLFAGLAGLVFFVALVARLRLEKEDRARAAVSLAHAAGVLAAASLVLALF
jgi:hypothetical protein